MTLNINVDEPKQKGSIAIRLCCLFCCFVNGEKHIYDEQTRISFTLQGDYYLPEFVLSDEEQLPIWIWGQRHLQYIKQHRKVLYTNLLTIGKLNGYLADIDKQSEDMLFQLVKQMAEREAVTEQLKAENQMEWVARMNNIRSRTTEIVNKDLVFI